MNVSSLHMLDLTEFHNRDDPTARVRADFPFSAATGNKNTACVYVEVQPGDHLPTHTDSAEELLVILQGTGRVTLGDERGEVTAGDVVLVPAMVPHSVRNVGTGKLRFVGVFSSNTVMSTFERPLVPEAAPDAAPAAAPFGERTILAPLPILLEGTRAGTHLATAI
ncbi:MAG: cupin domain-containing protein [Trueperaceae bacterium]